MSFPFDATLKDILQHHVADFAGVFQLPATRPVKILNVDLSTISAATDVAYGFGDPLEQIVDVNFQSSADRHVDSRMHLYNSAFHHRYHVPVRSLLVLLRPEADHSALTGEDIYGEGIHRVEFRYEAVRLWQQPVDSFLHSGLGLLPLATLCQLGSSHSEEAAVKAVVQEIHRRLSQEAVHGLAIKLMTATYVLTGLRFKRNTLASIFGGMGMLEESSAYQLILEKGEIKGMKKTLIKSGTQRFGSPDCSVEATINQIDNLEKIEYLHDNLFSSDSWADLLGKL